MISLMFGGLFGKKKSASVSGEAPKLSSAIASSILSVVGSKAIAPMPSAAQKAFQLSIDPNAEARDFIDVIESDEGLSARVLRIANSVYFDRGKRSTTIEEAVLVIGINELRCLLNANTLSELFPSKAPARALLWAHDIGTALTAKHLAQRFVPNKVELVFLGGLMHDVGKLLLLQRSAEQYGAVLTAVEQQGLSFSEAEEREFPFDHTEVGQLIGERWNFSSELMSMIRNHHRPWSDVATPGVPSLAGIIKAADLIAHALGFGHSKSMGKLRARAEESLAEMWETLRIPEGERNAVLASIRRTFETEFDMYASGGAKA